MRRSTHSFTDVAVVGAGPIGCAAALAHAAAGARVILFEASDRAQTRLAGEWLHPAGVDSLTRLGIELPTAAGRGFVVFPDDGSDPIELPYAAGRFAASIEHASLVQKLRTAAATRPGIRLVHGRVTGTSEGRLTYEERAGRPQTLTVDRILGADGRSSLVRRCARIEGSHTPVSRIAGLLLETEELPFEGYGHVLLGGPGPVLLYRLGNGKVRACIDRPARAGRATAAELWNDYAPFFPQSLLPALAGALRDRPPRWAATWFRPRSRPDHYGSGLTALLGDAVGEFHPLTAIGMTVGFGDAETLAAATSIETYRRARAASARVPELLSVALYDTFTRDDTATIAVRHSVYDLWRRSPADRERTMRLLATDETRLAPFSRTFLKFLGGAARSITRDAIARRAWPTEARDLAQWAGRLAGTTPAA